MVGAVVITVADIFGVSEQARFVKRLALSGWAGRVRGRVCVSAQHAFWLALVSLLWFFVSAPGASGVFRRGADVRSVSRLEAEAAYLA